MEILVGADPEVFVKDLNGNYVSAHNMIPGDKKNPFKVRRGAVQVDGMALEFNIDPAHSGDEFVTNIKDVFNQLKNMVPGYNVVVDPVAIFDKAYFDSCPTEAKILGCDPDYNAWTFSKNVPPNNELPMRTAAGHIHVGWGDGFDVSQQEHLEDCMSVTKQMDYYLGIYSLLWDQDNRRRSMYGNAGAFRPKSYGVEYRVLSNAWLASDDLSRWVYEATRKAVSDLAEGKSMTDLHGDAAKKIIDNNINDWYLKPEFKSLDILDYFDSYKKAA